MDLDLPPGGREEIEKALLASFTPDSFSHMLRLKLGFKVEEEVNTNKGLKYVISDVVGLAMEGWLDKLLLAAHEYKQGQSSKLNAIVGKYNVARPPKVVSETVAVKEEPGESTLQKTVRKRAPLVSFAAFASKLNQLKLQICRIEYPAGKAQGTGWLVGPDLVLTAYHVIKKVHENFNGLNGKDILCRFSYDGTKALADYRTCAVADDWLLASTMYSPADLKQTNTEPAANELDFALIRLKEKAGDDQLDSGATRGWIEIPENAPALMDGDFVIIPQHPDGRTLELAFGEVLKYNKPANRVQYDSNTEKGSSGSPCFDINLVPFALHHASGPGENLVYNQGVPLREIIKYAKKQTPVIQFWKS